MRLFPFLHNTQIIFLLLTAVMDYEMPTDITAISYDNFDAVALQTSGYVMWSNQNLLTLFFYTN